MLEQLDEYLATGKVKLVAISHVSNVLGTITDVKEVIKKCKNADAKILIDGAQAVPHMKVDIDNLGCDFYAFFGSQNVRSNRSWRSLGKKGVARKYETFPGWRRYDKGSSQI